MSKPRIIAFYLPQFYPFTENDEWWGKGFTEWTNVGKATPLFKGHYQPRVPADLGYYDLRVTEVREQQARLAYEAGIEGFCYWHYWFAGRRLLDRVFNEVLESGKPDFPFCLCWANHSWYKKTWTSEGKNILLLAQTYPGIEDYISHFNAMLPAFKDERYMKFDNKLIFGVFSPKDIPDFRVFKECWNNLAKENGLNGFYFFGYNIEPDKNQSLLDYGYDAVAIDYVRGEMNRVSKIYRGIMRFRREYLKLPQIRQYNSYVRIMEEDFKTVPNIYPVLVPNFDHSPRSGTAGIIMHDSTPQKWGNLCRHIFATVEDRPHEENLVFIKAWNEWGEGNYLEPDLKFGKQYLEELRDSISIIND